VVLRDVDDTLLETVPCFRCGDPGESLFDVAPYGVRRCGTCGLVFISPRLDEEGRHRLYDTADYFEGRVYSDNGTADEGGMATWLQHRWSAGRLAAIDAYRGGRRGAMLEVGCAFGLFAEHARRGGYDVTALELSSVAAAVARERVGMDVYEGHLEDAPYPDGDFDVVVAWDVVEHVPDPSTFLAKIHALLRPGGTVALSCPTVASLPARALRDRWWTLKPDEHIWHFAPRTLAAALTDAGFSGVAISANPLRRGNLGRLDSMLALARRN
jgi:2-polyprenyl-3-methyl-5-hydroxy-6-metoxy-1,4-benzoquinol methylase